MWKSVYVGVYQLLNRWDFSVKKQHFFLYPLFHYAFLYNVSVILVRKYFFYVSFSKKEYNFV